MGRTELHDIDLWRRAANYLSVGQIHTAPIGWMGGVEVLTVPSDQEAVIARRSLEVMALRSS